MILLGGWWERFKDMGIGKALLATVATHFNSVSVGMCQGYSAILLPQLQTTTSSIQITTADASWLASLGVATNPLGALLSGFLMEWLGRKGAVQLVSIPFFIGWIIIALSQNIFILYIGRAITGVAIGMSAACYVYVTEICLPDHRGFLSAFGPIFVSLGVLLVYTFGYLFSWQVASACCAVVAALSGAVMLLVPESPSWLLSHNKEKQARKAIIWFRGDTNEAATELADLSESIRVKEMENEKAGNHWRQFIEPSVWKPFLIMVFFFVFQELSGLYIILYYAVNFIQSAGSTMDSYVLGILMATVRLVMSMIGSVCIKRFNRRTMAITSAICMSSTMFVAGTYEYFYYNTTVADRPLSWVPQLFTAANIGCSMLGMLQLPWVMNGELFPTAVRGIMGGVTSSLGYLFIFCVVQLYLPLLSALLIYGIMWLFAVTTLFSIAYFIWVLPETQGKTLLEIEAKFRGE